MTPSVLKAATMFPARAAEYKWFDMSSLPPEKPYAHAEVARLISLPLPFSKCGIAGRDAEGMSFAVLATMGTEEKYKDCVLIETAIMVSTPVQRVEHFGAYWVHPALSDGEGLYMQFLNHEDYRNKRTTAVMKVSSMILAMFMKTVHEDTQEYQMYEPTASRSNPKRIRQGKTPLFDWNTVTIQPKRHATPAQGGTHASPRLHDVRGHWVVRNGKKFWRKPHQRGDINKGVVFSNYQLKGATP